MVILGGVKYSLLLVEGRCWCLLLERIFFRKKFDSFSMPYCTFFRHITTITSVKVHIRPNAPAVNYMVVKGASVAEFYIN